MFFVLNWLCLRSVFKCYKSHVEYILAYHIVISEKISISDKSGIKLKEKYVQNASRQLSCPQLINWTIALLWH